MLTGKTAADLILAVRRAEGWLPRKYGDGAQTIRRMNELYEVKADPEHNRFTATRKAAK